MTSLYHYFLQHHTSKPHFADIPVNRIAQALRYMPLDLRKFVVNCCRTQVDIDANLSLTNELYGLSEENLDVGLVEEGRVYRLSQLKADIDSVLHSQIFTALLSLLARTERPYDLREFREQKDKLLLKELKASMLPDLPQRLDYRSLFVPDIPPPRVSDYCPHPPVQLAQVWASGLNMVQKDHVMYTYTQLAPQLPLWYSDVLDILDYRPLAY